MERFVRCECGYLVVGELATVIAAARQHALDDHQLTVSDDFIVALARPRVTSAAPASSGVPSDDAVMTTGPRGPHPIRGEQP